METENDQNLEKLNFKEFAKMNMSHNFGLKNNSCRNNMRNGFPQISEYFKSMNYENETDIEKNE